MGPCGPSGQDEEDQETLVRQPRAGPPLEDHLLWKASLTPRSWAAGEAGRVVRSGAGEEL